MSNRISCPNCSYANSKHRRTCKQCRVSLEQVSKIVSDNQPSLEATVETRHKMTQEEAGGELWKGLLWLIGGIVVTVGTYSAAAPGETYFVAWGAILFGGIQFLKGASNYLTK